MIKWLFKIFDRSNDPVYSCSYHKEHKCSHVDGYLCEMKTCNILKTHNFKELGKQLNNSKKSYG